ncbi:FAD/NAD(P)-binding domain-containing protein [Coniochaeta sp. PMI_546]|nr:FAD/NAD(P)-binding domain-containing protein [Coniochaeta sp. PMI_546]
MAVATAVKPRTRTRVADLPSAIPQVSGFDGEDQLDPKKEAEAFLNRFSNSVKAGNWHEFSKLFSEDPFWRDSLALTFDRRTLSGKDAIVQAWKTLALTKQPSDFALTTKDNQWIALEPEFVRLAPTMASLDVPFTFKTKNPDAQSVGLAKLIPVDGTWKVWVLSTAIQSLDQHPFKALPRQPSLGVDENLRGRYKAQGLPHIDSTLDAVVVGGSTSGLTNAVMLEAIGAKAVCFTTEPEVGYQWSQGRYENLMTHNPKAVMQLPYFPFPAEGYDDILDGPGLQRYYRSAVETLKLPVFAGIKVIRNEWDENAKVWHVTARDTKTGEEKTYHAKNIVLSTGWVFPTDAPKWPKLENRHLFKGHVQHTVEYRTAEPYKGLDVVVVGSGSSGHDVAHNLAVNGAKSVTLLQRSPTTLLDYETAEPILFGRYQGQIPVDTADFLEFGMPLGVLRDMARHGFAAVMQSREELSKKLEAKGYMQDRHPCMITNAYEQKGRGFYSDQPRTFQLVLDDRIKIQRGEARGFAEDGLVVRDRDTGADRVIEAGGVVFATGYETVDLNEKWAETGFLDAKSAAAIENVSLAGVDDEGELVGYGTYSGHPHLYFGGISGYFNRVMSRHIAIQVMADVSGEFPGRYQEAERYAHTPSPMYK